MLEVSLQSYKTWYFNKVKFKSSGIMIFQIVIIIIARAHT